MILSSVMSRQPGMDMLMRWLPGAEPRAAYFSFFRDRAKPLRLEYKVCIMFSSTCLGLRAAALHTRVSKPVAYDTEAANGGQH